MIKHFMNYGDKKFAVPLPEQNIAAELEPNAVSLPQMTPEEHVRYAINHPLDSEPLEKLLSPGETVCIVIPDSTRLWQSPQVYITAVVEKLNQCGIHDKDILIISATGTHRTQSKEEHIKLVGENLYHRIRVEDHVSTDKENLVLAGTTSRGTPVWLNAHAMACDKLILTGGVVYHFLAGYGGGPKYVLPGISGYETIMHNHNFALNEGFGSGSNPAVRSSNMETNPFQLDLMEASAFAKPCFLVNVVVDSEYNIIRAFAGNYVTAHRAACELVDSIDGVYVQQKTPLVIASAGGYPKDINFYQTIKTLSNALAIVTEEKGTLILLSRCSEGIGSEDCRSQLCDYGSMLEREKALRANFSIGGYVGFLFCESAERHHLIMVTDMPKDVFAKTRIHPVSTLDEALELAREFNGGSLDMKVSLLPHGASTLPKFKE